MSYVETMTVNCKSQEYITYLLKGLVKLFGIKEIPNDKFEDEVIPCLYSLVKEAQEHGKDILININKLLNKSSEEEKKKSFYTVVDSLFEDNIKWSRIIVAFMYIIEVLKISKSEYSKYFQWSVELICDRINPWVLNNGGWGNIVVLSKNRNNLDDVTDTVKQIGKVVLGITGLFALGKWLLN